MSNFALNAKSSTLATLFVFLGLVCCCCGYRLKYIIAICIAISCTSYLIYLSPLYIFIPLLFGFLTLCLSWFFGGRHLFFQLATLGLHAIGTLIVGGITVWAIHPTMDLEWALLYMVFAIFMMLIFVCTLPYQAIIFATSTIGTGLIVHGSALFIPDKAYNCLDPISFAMIEIASISLQVYLSNSTSRRLSAADTVIATPTPTSINTPIAITTPPLVEEHTITIHSVDIK
ncbi:hypothetical protein THRCLA_23086 [Thraustotheca clavata]|uniref:DUF4203 domain-containing protein n=1 Tax=Thraustotheca clavata TaxID=74557 RepID=A0A1V9YF36_9STRA|nr:hypothetical protein THRCLA_23086 [Thraustotheca clavata]